MIAPYLLEQSLLCRRAPMGRFKHPWLSPMPALPTRHNDDGFARGDYSQGMFHHDVSEAAIWGLQQPDLVDAIAGSLLCFLDCAAPSGRVYRALLAHKSREQEPAKPVIAQLALRVVRVKGDAWARAHDVYARVQRWVDYLAEHYTGMHGLILTHSSLASGFDTDLMSAGFPDRTVEGPDTTAFMILEYEAAAELLGLQKYREQAERLRELMNTLMWVDDGYYTALRWQHGVGSLELERVPVETWASLLPLYARVPDERRAARMIARLRDPDGYWGPYGVRTLPKWSPYFGQAARVMHFDFKKNGRGPVSNWSGPVWVLANYYMHEGLRAYGHESDLLEKTRALLDADLRATGMLHECYDDAGNGLWPRHGTFISWNVLSLLT